MTADTSDADSPVLDTLADMTASSIEHSTLVPCELMLARVAALITLDAPPASYLANAAAAAETGVTINDVQGVMIAVSPIVATARVVSAGGRSCEPWGSRSPSLRPNWRRSWRSWKMKKIGR